MKSKASKPIISLVFTLVISVVVLVVGSIIVSSTTSKTREVYKNYLRRVEGPEQLRVLQGDFKEIGPQNIQLLENAYPSYNKDDSGAILPFIQTLEALQDDFRIHHTLNLDEEVTSEGGLSYLNFSLSFRATAAQASSYIKNLSKLQFFVEINSVTIVDQVNIKGESQVLITARLYVRGQ